MFKIISFIFGILAFATASANPLPEGDVKRVIERTLKILEQEYVYPKVAKDMSRHVRSLVEEGGYQSVEDLGQLAEKLTKDLRFVSKDKHLRVNAKGHRPRSQESNRPQVDFRTNYGFEESRMLDGGVGYMKFNIFSQAQAAFTEAQKQLERIEGANAIIFDLRDNVGGSPRMIEFISSYIFDKPTQLNVFYDRTGRRTGQSLTYSEIPGKRFSKATPIFVLTSNMTFSAAEEFTYNLQSFKKATIVGEITGGGAHPVTRVEINRNMSVTVPFQRAFNPITKTNWEGVGVVPDVKIHRDEALNKALSLIKKNHTEKINRL